MSEPNPVNTQTYHVFLASPGDMNAERKMVCEYFEKINREIFRHKNLCFEVLCWEEHVTAGMGRPQEIINAQTLQRYRKSLVLVICLLGQRYGTPTGRFGSGTEEEFNNVLTYRMEQGHWPEIKWFFRTNFMVQFDDPEQLNGIQDQWQKVKALKQKLQSQFLTVDFPDTPSFAEIFQKDVTPWLSQPEQAWNKTAQINISLPESHSSIPTAELFSIWQNRLADECGSLPLEVIDAKQTQVAEPITLADIFVPLSAVEPSPAWQDCTHQDLKLARELNQAGDNEPIPVLNILAKQRLSVILGEPGSGKSTLVNQLVYSLIKKGDDDSLPDALRQRLAVRIILRRVPIPEVGAGEADWLWQAIEAEIRETLEKNQFIDPRYAQQVREKLHTDLVRHNGIILLDGLDEVSATDERRPRLLQAIKALVTALPKANFVVTARPYAYTDPKWRLKDFVSFALMPFNAEQRAQFIHNWYQASKWRLALSQIALTQRSEDLIDQIENLPHLRELAERPLLLTLIANLHTNNGRLPDDRAELYKNSVDLLLFRWRREALSATEDLARRLEKEKLQRSLQQLAHTAHCQQQTQAEAIQTADIAKADILAAFDPLLDTVGRDELLRFLQQHTGILIARDQDYYAFPHRSFQEYLAMGWLTSYHDDHLTPQVLADPIWWREVFLLAVLEQRSTPRMANLLIEDLDNAAVKLDDTGQWRVLILAGLALLELRGSANNKLQLRLRDKLIELLENPQALNPAERAEAGRVLFELGDTRPGVGLNADDWPDIDWVDIPAGKIKLDKNAGTYPVAAFQLARYPITNKQFQSFIEDGGYENPVWWQGLDLPEDHIKDREESYWPIANHPRENVSWYEAMAFCAWLSAKLGYAITLPTEWQWQQAACSGNPKFNYPWGKDYQTSFANIRDSIFLGKTTSVGIYPKGNSTQGVCDLSGNVWEWCLNSYHEPENTAISGTFSRVLRGGSWGFNSVDARAAFRFYGNPDYRYGNIGFRVCRASPIDY